MNGKWTHPYSKVDHIADERGRRGNEKGKSKSKISILELEDARSNVSSYCVISCQSEIARECGEVGETCRSSHLLSDQLPIYSHFHCLCRSRDEFGKEEKKLREGPRGLWSLTISLFSLLLYPSSDLGGWNWPNENICVFIVTDTCTLAATEGWIAGTWEKFQAE